MTKCSQLIEIDIGRELRVVTFSANGDYLMSGDSGGVRVWRVEDRTLLETMETAGTVRCLAASRDGKWIAAGISQHGVFLWNAETYAKVFEHREDTTDIHGVEFSPDSTRLVVPSQNSRVTVWDLETRTAVHSLPHEFSVIAAKYSLQGDRIATATWEHVRVWDGHDGRLLVDIPEKVEPWTNNGLLWSNNHLFVVAKGKIRELEASSGSTVAEWSVPDANIYSCITLPKHGQCITYSTWYTVTFFDTSTRTQLGQVQHPQNICSIVHSPDDRFIAIGGDKGKISVKHLSRITDSVPLSRLHHTFHEPDIHIDDAALDAWKHNQLENTDTLLTAAINTSQNPSHQVLASRALVRAHLKKWDVALTDAEKAIDIQPSIIAYIAKSIAHVRSGGDKQKGYEACDIAFEHFHSSHGTFLLFIKAIIVCMAGEHRDAIARMDELIAAAPLNSIYYIVQAYMYLLLGNSRMERSDHESAIQSFGRARAQMQHYGGRPLLIVSLISGWQFDDLHLMIRQHLSEALYAATRTTDAVECFHEMTRESGGETVLHGQHREWAYGFRQRASEKLEHLGNAAANAQRYDEAISYYTIALSLDPPFAEAMLIKRNQAFARSGSWERALENANQATTLNPSSPWGYEMKYVALHKSGDYANAVDAFEVMLSKIKQSPDPDVQQLGDRYIDPSSTRATIRKVVQRTLRRLPRVLIHTTTGRLHDRAEQAAAFESLPIFNALVSLMTTRIDYVRIKREVRQYFRYVMLSHRWEGNEPLYQQVIHMSVYHLDHTPTHDKLQTFCRIVRDSEFVWAWSDTCCINKADHFILQEALVAMFEWYQGSVVVIVFLRGVRSSSRRGALVNSIWNTRAWTLQEYIAAKVVHFYTEDWTFYLDLELPNHKWSPDVISEMQEATGVPAEQLMALRPGLTNIREKLRLASTRQTTLVEDAAYSLLGIFSAVGIPAIYGEGEASLGRLLANVVTRSGDVNILAWTGDSSRFNSCLPARIAVYNGTAASHLPARIPDAEMDRIVAASLSFDLDVALRLYDRLAALPTPRFAESRMTLACIAFRLPSLSLSRAGSTRVYCADTVAFGMVEIRTKRDLSKMKSLYLVHPWLESLLEREDVHGGGAVEEDDIAPPSSPHTDGEASEDEDINDEGASIEDMNDDDDDDDDDNDEFYDASSHFDPESPSRLTTVPPMDMETRARRFVARLRQPFGALLLTLTSVDGRVVGYKRVAADSVVNVQFLEDVSLADILKHVRTVDVL